MTQNQIELIIANCRLQQWTFRRLELELSCRFPGDIWHTPAGHQLIDTIWERSSNA